MFMQRVYIFIAFVVFSVSPARKGVAQTLLLRIPTPPSYKITGVQGVGDVNHDGHDDILIGSVQENDFTGKAYVISGLTGSTLYTFVGNREYDYFGSSLASGDVNGDGFPDLVVAAPQNNTSYPGVGYVKIYSGADGHLIRTEYGQSSMCLFGCSVAVADVNNDSYQDVVVGAPWQFDTGAVHIRCGKTGIQLAVLRGEKYGDMFGNSVANAGDIDGDRLDDIIVGAPACCSTTKRGYVCVYRAMAGQTLYTFHCLIPHDYFGNHVESAGDVNRDGVPDIIVGAKSSARTNQTDYSRVFSGSDGSLLHHVVAAHSWSGWSGQDVCGVGDLNQDGYDDFCCTSPGNTLAPQVYSGRDLAVLHTFEAFRLTAPVSVSRAGDVNGDGVPDFAIEDFWGPAYVFSGFCGARKYGTEYRGANTGRLATYSRFYQGSMARLELSGFKGNPVGTVAFSTRNTSTPFMGGTLLVDPQETFLVVPFAILAGKAAVQVPVPRGMRYAGFTFHVQAAVIDPAQKYGIAFTNGLTIGICP